MCPPDLAADQVFVLRFWRERISIGNSQWRAQVSYVNARERLTANSIEAAFAQVLSRLDVALTAVDRTGEIS